MFKRVKTIIICLCAGILFAIMATQASAEDSRQQIRVGVLPVFQELPILVSKKEAAVAYKNIAVTVEVFKSWTSLEAAYRTGMIDAAGITVVKAFNMSLDNVPLTIALFLHRNGSSLVLKIDSTKQALMNKIIGTSGTDTGDTILLYRYLQKLGMKIGLDTRFLLIPMQKSTNLLTEGEVSGFMLPEPFGTIAKMQGLAKKYILGKEISPGYPDVVLIINPKLISKNKAALQEWVNSIVKSGAFIEEDKTKTGGEQTSLIQSDVFKYSEKITKEVLTNPKDGILFNDMAVNKKDLEDIVKDALTLEIISAEIDLSKIIDTSFSQ